MKIRQGSPADVPRALEIWRAAVDATHGFLTPGDRTEIDRMVAEQFLPQAGLWLVESGTGKVVGFLVMDGDEIDALFVDPAVHGQGYGTALIQHALTLSPHATVEASEQASNALPFYEARGFVRIGRSETDPQGRPYPLVRLRYDGAGSRKARAGH
ncbi:acetyltransferase [Pelagerythrobacter marinus]|uniref:acetyltransferase n=1 Tax=Pelagerythrobacter marinus TaxID=538382 RepID=UPI002036E247|nr:acetyltransferase [Pelagerythrobacter marinus]USA39278.1 acetyltransferase [Pelagerythrobacter marinus]WPZ06634.1 acetyltransferase [Pelagerythrobacter marinus]